MMCTIYSKNCLPIKTGGKVRIPENGRSFVEGTMRHRIFMPRSTDVIALPNMYFMDLLNFENFHQSANDFCISGNKVESQILGSLQEADAIGARAVYAPVEWSNLTRDDTGRSMRSFLETNADGRARRHGYNFDLYRQISMAIQLDDKHYAAHVRQWYQHHAIQG